MHVKLGNQARIFLMSNWPFMRFILSFFSIVLIFSLLIPLIFHEKPTLHFVSLAEYDDALCLDGSHASYYISKDGDPKKFYIAFEAGGWCYGPNSVGQTIESCYKRSKTGGGSTKYDQKTLTYNEGVLSTHQNNNFRTWTRVYLKYCDGSGHQGTKLQSVLHNGKKIYFRGHNITVSQLDSLEKHHKLFSEATHVVVGGFSAGGLAAFTWVNYIKERVKIGKVWGMPDSGIFLDSTNVTSGQNDYKLGFKNLVSLVNKQIQNPLTQCAQKYVSQPQKCMFAENLAPFVKAPIFVIQSLYDTWSIQNILNISCIKSYSFAKCSQKEVFQIEEYKKNTSEVILKIGSKEENGYWAPVCAFHMICLEQSYYNSTFRIPGNSGNSVMKAVDNWLQLSSKSNSKFIDLGKWPDNLPCAGKTK